MKKILIGFIFVLMFVSLVNAEEVYRINKEDAKKFIDEQASIVFDGGTGDISNEDLEKISESYNSQKYSSNDYIEIKSGNIERSSLRILQDKGSQVEVVKVEENQVEREIVTDGDYSEDSDNSENKYYLEWVEVESKQAILNVIFIHDEDEVCQFYCEEKNGIYVEKCRGQNEKEGTIIRKHYMPSYHQCWAKRVSSSWTDSYDNGYKGKLSACLCNISTDEKPVENTEVNEQNVQENNEDILDKETDRLESAGKAALDRERHPLDSAIESIKNPIKSIKKLFGF
jgi:hypothetical protein